MDKIEILNGGLFNYRLDFGFNVSHESKLDEVGSLLQWAGITISILLLYAQWSV